MMFQQYFFSFQSFSFDSWSLFPEVSYFWTLSQGTNDVALFVNGDKKTFSCSILVIGIIVMYGKLL